MCVQNNRWTTIIVSLERIITNCQIFWMPQHRIIRLIFAIMPEIIELSVDRVVIRLIPGNIPAFNIEDFTAA